MREGTADGRGPAGAVALAVVGGAVGVGAWWLAIVVFDIESYTAPTPR